MTSIVISKRIPIPSRSLIVDSRSRRGRRQIERTSLTTGDAGISNSPRTANPSVSRGTPRKSAASQAHLLYCNFRHRLYPWNNAMAYDSP
jgi:hypothetical protein